MLSHLEEHRETWRKYGELFPYPGHVLRGVCFLQMLELAGLRRLALSFYNMYVSISFQRVPELEGTITQVHISTAGRIYIYRLYYTK